MRRMSYEAFKKLNCKCESTSTQLTSFSNVDTPALGTIRLCLTFEKFEDDCQFYIAQPGQTTHDVILSRSWMRRTKCSIDWDANMVHLSTHKDRVTLPLVMQTSNIDTTPIKHNLPLATTLAESTQMFSPRGTHDHEASTSHAAKEIRHNPQLSQGAKPELTVQRQHDTPCVRKQWVPKTVLEAQGYYQGTKILWIPKPQPPTRPTKSKSRKSHADPIPYTTRVTPTMYWRPKKLSPPKTLIPPQQPKNQKKWVVKSSNQLANVQPRARPSRSHAKHAQANLFAQLDKLKIWLPKSLSDFKAEVIPAPGVSAPMPTTHIELGDSQPLTIRDRAQNLQRLLHGKSSL